MKNCLVDWVVMWLTVGGRLGIRNGAGNKGRVACGASVGGIDGTLEPVLRQQDYPRFCLRSNDRWITKLKKLSDIHAMLKWLVKLLGPYRLV